jgi:hypothetical protein
MFFIKRNGVLVPTTLKANDRIRVRPGLDRFFVWRPAYLLFDPLYEFMPGGRLWTPDGTGRYRKWLPIPPQLEGESLDMLSLIARQCGEENFRPPGLEWVDQPLPHPDARYEFMAVDASMARAVR